MLTYTTETTYFRQDDPSTDPATFQFTADFGLINQVYDGKETTSATPWQSFSDQIKSLNVQASANESYRLLYLGRHGEGEHNVAEATYGTPAWDNNYSHLDSFEDAHLTDRGRQQALTANAFFKSALASGLPAPQTYYVSPLDRCLETAHLTWQGLDVPAAHPFKPLVKELVREVLGIHACDRRSSASYIREHYPLCVLEPGFSEQDPLWRPDERESEKEVQTRVKRALDDIFTHDGSTIISITSHSGAIRGMLAVLGHREFALSTGALIPVLIKIAKS